MIWFIIAVLAFILIGYFGNKQRSKHIDQMSAQGFDTANSIPVGKYLGGHPNIDKSFNYMEIFSNESQLHIYGGENKFSKTKPLGIIEKSQVTDVAVVDSSTMQSRLSIGAIALVGIFAFALPKNKKMEVAYTSIKWNDGKFNHETIFEFQNKGAMQMANAARNKIIKILQ